MHSIAQSLTNSFLNFFSISFHSSPKQSFYNLYYNPLPHRRPPQFDQFSFITFASSALAFAFAAICCNFVRCGAFPSVSANLMGSPSSPPLSLSLPHFPVASPLPRFFLSAIQACLYPSLQAMSALIPFA